MKTPLIFIGKNHAEAIALQAIYSEYKVIFAFTLRDCETILNNYQINNPLLIVDYTVSDKTAPFIKKIKQLPGCKVIAYFPDYKKEKDMAQALKAGADNILDQSILNTTLVRRIIQETRMEI